MNLIAVGVDGSSRSRDAVALAGRLAAPTGARLMLIAVRAEPLVPVAPDELDPNVSEKQAWETLARVRDSLAPDALLEVQTDVVVWRALRHVVRAKHADLLVVGSAFDARQGCARLGRDAGRLRSHLECPLVVAPRGAAALRDAPLATIGVGLEDTAESRAGLEVAASLAAAAGAEVALRRAIPNRLAVRVPVAHSGDATAAASDGGVDIAIGRARDQLLDLAEHVDLVVVGSSRRGRRGTVAPGATADALLHDAPCPVVVVPRPAGP